MPACKWMMVRGCMRCIDGVSRNRTREDCYAGPVAPRTVDELLATLPALPAPPQGGTQFTDLYAVPDAAWMGFAPGTVLRDANTGEWVAVYEDSPMVLHSPLPVGPAALDIALPTWQGNSVVTEQTVQHTTPTQTAVPEPSSAAVLGIALAVGCIAMTWRK